MYIKKGNVNGKKLLYEKKETTRAKQAIIPDKTKTSKRYSDTYKTGFLKNVAAHLSMESMFVN